MSVDIHPMTSTLSIDNRTPWWWCHMRVSSGTPLDWVMMKIDLIYKSHNAPVPYPTMHQSHIPQCTSPISHNVPFCNRNVHMCAHFCYKMVHCGIFVWCIVGFARWDYWNPIASTPFIHHFDGLMQKRCNSSASAMELHLFCIKPSILWWCHQDMWMYSGLLAFIEGKPLVTGGWIPFTKGQ